MFMIIIDGGRGGGEEKEAQPPYTYLDSYTIYGVLISLTLLWGLS